MPCLVRNARLSLPFPGQPVTQSKNSPISTAFQLNSPTQPACAKHGDGLLELRKAIELAALSSLSSPCDLDVVVNERQSDALRRASDYLTCALEDLKDGAGCELVSQQLRAGLSALGEIVGQTATE